jgi:hypothetical protein
MSYGTIIIDLAESIQIMQVPNSFSRIHPALKYVEEESRVEKECVQRNHMHAWMSQQKQGKK